MKIVLIAIDTLRADRLGCYNNRKPSLTPHLDSLAKQGVLFENMIAENNVTRSSFVTIMTGKNPHQHGIVNMKHVPIPARLVPLAQILQKHGYTTAAVDCNHRITGKNSAWFKKGYQTYIDPAGDKETHLTLPAREVSQKAVAWLKKHAHEPDFFLFLHYWDPHYPYMPEPPYAKWAEKHAATVSEVRKEPSLKAVMREPLWSFINKYNKSGLPASSIRQRYDGSVKQVDDSIGDIIKVLSETGTLEETLLIAVADHGESLGEHRIYFDHHGLYEPTIHVPCIISYPKRLPKNKRITPLCQHADIFPTVLHLAGIRKPKGIGRIDGRSLLPLIQGKVKQIRPFVVSCEANWQLKRSIRTLRWKLIRSYEKDVYGNPKWELYDLKKDRGETKNVIAQHPQVAKQLRGQMERWVKQMLQKYRRKDPLAQGVKVKLHRATVADEEKVKQRLSELGY
ncbi:sulfatase [Thermoactinomyces sp. CICC 10521]|uniref:sulfatase family protein n=1 Tax=Thermoactinomyces sp. CICC 10521 TaxID=2767426 RepID=UPI0018DE5831|nr:sulfatase [Thermoactinomyces sp. CICC 10521]MBH8607475.1 sulfatase [Thermoactinomyces sp. CICC 10521]